MSVEAGRIGQNSFEGRKDWSNFCGNRQNWSEFLHEQVGFFRVPLRMARNG